MMEMETEPTLDMTMLRRLVEIDKRRKEIDAEDKQLAAERTGLEQVLINQFEQTGMERASVDGRTVYVRVQLWARAANGMVASLCERLLNDDNTKALVSETVNTSKLSAHFREQLDGMLAATEPHLTRGEALDRIKVRYEGTLELADQISLQSRGK